MRPARRTVTVRAKSSLNERTVSIKYVRGTEHMQDQNGNVSDLYTDYNYHWADGFGKFVHTGRPESRPEQIPEWKLPTNDTAAEVSRKLTELGYLRPSCPLVPRQNSIRARNGEYGLKSLACCARITTENHLNALSRLYRFAFRSSNHRHSFSFEILFLRK